jgi:hypothetical protein
MKEAKKNFRKKARTVDDTYNLINDLVSREDVCNYLDLNTQFMICHKCIDGLGINYSKNEIISIKFYLKIFDTQPKFSDRFIKEFLSNEEFKSRFVRLCILNNATPELRSNGLTGVNTSLKIHLINNSTSRSVYRRIGTKASEAITLSGNEVSSEKYKYIFNRGLQSIIRLFYNIQIPRCAGGMEFYSKGEGINKAGEIAKIACATAYPPVELKKNPKVYLSKYFNNLQSKKPWDIEESIIKGAQNFNKHIIPITKGYQKGDVTRKIYLSTLSTKYSSIRKVI